MTQEILKKSAAQIHEMIKNKEVTAVEVLDEFYKRIDEVEDKIGAFNSYTREQAYATAKKVDEKVKNGEELPLLAGVPLALKDNINMKDTVTTASSEMLKNFVSPFDATVVRKLNENLIPIVGKMNMDEFAMGSSNENSAFKKVHNPWNLNKVPGGSSGGSAAAVSALEAPLALGSDTGGSIRLPASFCGITGLKPTYGRVSRFGLIAFASSLDQIGPFAKTVEDTAMLLEIISGLDAKDSTSLDNKELDFTSTLKDDIKGKKIGVVKELLAEGVNPDVKNAIEQAIETYKKAGAEIFEISLPLLKYSIGVYYIIATAEASSNLARYDGVRYTQRAKDCNSLIEMYNKTRAEFFGEEVKRRIMLGTYALSSGYYDAYYKKAQQLRRLIKEDFDKAFAQVDVLLCPTCPDTAFELGSKVSDPLSMYLMDIGTITANLAGIPGISIPCGFDKDNMPIGMQLLAQTLNEKTLLNVAHKYQTITDFHNSFAKL